MAMHNATPFFSSFSLEELSELSDEVLFAFHISENKFVYLNAAFEKVWNMPRETISSNLPLLLLPSILMTSRI
jgi:two-component system, OmpR family, sensor histidine kinase VicK